MFGWRPACFYMENEEWTWGKSGDCRVQLVGKRQRGNYDENVLKVKGLNVALELESMQAILFPYYKMLSEL